MMRDKHIIKNDIRVHQMLCTAKRVLDNIEYFDLTKNNQDYKMHD